MTHMEDWNLKKNVGLMVLRMNFVDSLSRPGDIRRSLRPAKAKITSVGVSVVGRKWSAFVCFIFCFHF